MSDKEPFFNVREPSVIFVIGVLIAVHIWRSFVGPSDWVFFTFALYPLDFTGQVSQPINRAYTLLTHGFLHLDFSHLLMNSASILIFGLLSFQGVRAKYGFGIGGLIRLWLIFFIGIVAGGLASWLEWDLMGRGYIVALGASGGASALFAATGWAIGGKNGLARFTLAFAVLNFILVFYDPSISWVAHAGGFVAGAVLSYFWVKPFSVNPSMRR